MNLKNGNFAIRLHLQVFNWFDLVSIRFPGNWQVCWEMIEFPVRNSFPRNQIKSDHVPVLNENHQWRSQFIPNQLIM